MKFNEAKIGMEVYTVANDLGNIISVDKNKVVVEFNMIDDEGHGIVKEFNRRQISTLFERSKIGDIVRIIRKEDDGFLRKGDIGIITDVNDHTYQHNVFFREFVSSPEVGCESVSQTSVQKIAKKITDEQKQSAIIQIACEINLYKVCLAKCTKDQIETKKECIDLLYTYQNSLKHVLNDL